MTDKMENWIRTALANHLFEQEKPGDYVVLADSTLRAALEGTRPLQHAEFAALMNSPRTLARFRRLVLARKAELSRSAGGQQDGVCISTAADEGETTSLNPGAVYTTRQAETHHGLTASNDAQWFSRCNLRMGRSLRELETMHTEDRRFSLAVVQRVSGYQLVLRADPAHPEFAALRGKTLQVVDGTGSVLIQGELDEDGELQQPWAFILPPISYLLEHGACFDVRPV